MWLLMARQDPNQPGHLGMFSFRIKTVFHTDEKMLCNLLVLECLPVPPVLSLCSIHMDSNNTESSFQAKNDK